MLNHLVKRDFASATMYFMALILKILEERNKNMEIMEEELKGFRFNLTPEIQNIMIDLLVHKQLLEEGNLESDKKELVEKIISELLGIALVLVPPTKEIKLTLDSLDKIYAPK